MIFRNGVRYALFLTDAWQFKSVVITFSFDASINNTSELIMDELPDHEAAPNAPLENKSRSVVFSSSILLLAGIAMGTTVVTHKVLDETASLYETLTVSSAILAIACLIGGFLAYTKEKQPVLLSGTLALAGLALVWQYILIGIIVAVIVVVLLFLLFATDWFDSF